jgi:hypothetical protein
MTIRPAVESDVDQTRTLIESIPGLWHPDWRLDVLERAIRSADGLAVVLPNPAGAEINASLRPARSPSFNRTIRRGRGTALGRGGGTYSLLARTGADMAALYNARVTCHTVTTTLPFLCPVST